LVIGTDRIRLGCPSWKQRCHERSGAKLLRWRVTLPDPGGGVRPGRVSGTLFERQGEIIQVIKSRGVRALGWRPAWVFGPSWRTSVLYLAGMGDERVSVEGVAEAGDILAEEVDVLLERLTDKVLASPRAGSRAWYTQWNAHNSPDGQRRRLLVKIAIASHAGIDPVHDIERARQIGTSWVSIGRAAGLSSPTARRRWGTTPVKDRQLDIGQLAIW